MFQWRFEKNYAMLSGIPLDIYSFVSSKKFRVYRDMDTSLTPWIHTSVIYLCLCALNCFPTQRTTLSGWVFHSNLIISSDFVMGNSINKIMRIQHPSGHEDCFPPWNPERKTFSEQFPTMRHLFPIKHFNNLIYLCYLPKCKLPILVSLLNKQHPWWWLHLLGKLLHFLQCVPCQLK